eukprot:3940984-Rhodomonas_salina.3
MNERSSAVNGSSVIRNVSVVTLTCPNWLSLLLHAVPGIGMACARRRHASAEIGGRWCVLLPPACRDHAP